MMSVPQDDGSKEAPRHLHGHEFPGFQDFSMINKVWGGAFSISREIHDFPFEILDSNRLSARQAASVENYECFIQWVTCVADLSVHKSPANEFLDLEWLLKRMQLGDKAAWHDILGAAAKHHHPMAQAMVAILFGTGWDYLVPQDLDLAKLFGNAAVLWLQSCASTGCNYGRTYFAALGCLEICPIATPAECLKFLHLAVDEGFSEAYFWLTACCYNIFKNIQVDISTGLEHLCFGHPKVQEAIFFTYVQRNIMEFQSMLSMHRNNLDCEFGEIQMKAVAMLQSCHEEDCDGAEGVTFSRLKWDDFQKCDCEFKCMTQAMEKQEQQHLMRFYRAPCDIASFFDSMSSDMLENSMLCQSMLVDSSDFHRELKNDLLSRRAFLRKDFNDFYYSIRGRLVLDIGMM